MDPNQWQWQQQAAQGQPAQQYPSAPYAAAQYPPQQAPEQYTSYAPGYAVTAPPSAPPHLAGGYAPTPAMSAGSYASQYSAPYAPYSEPSTVTYPSLPAYSEPPRQSRAPSHSAPSQSAQFAPEEPGGPEGSARFKVIILPEDGGDILDVICQVGLDGIKLLDAGRKTTLRIYALENISRWTVRDPTILTFYAKMGGESGEKAVNMSSDERTTRSILDVLTSSCLQLCELRGIDPGDMSGTSATNKLLGTAPVPAAPVPASAAGIEFWRSPDYSGWLTKKGEHLSTWRRRWFVLKDGHLFWFLNQNVGSSSKPRGTISLKNCARVRSSTVAEAGKPYALELDAPEANAAGARHLLGDSETEKNAWVTALQKALDGIKAAGAPPASRSHEELAARLRQGFDTMSATTGGSRMVDVSYGSGGSGGGGGGGGGRRQESSSYGGGGGYSQPPASVWQVHYTNDGKTYYFNPQTNKTQWDPPAGYS